jgi:hypothetical protein
VLARGLYRRVAQDEMVVIPDRWRSVLALVWWIGEFGSVELGSRTKSKSTRCVTSLLSVGQESYHGGKFTKAGTSESAD